jgi:hypothetical protein
MKLNIRKTETLMGFLQYKRKLKKQLAILTDAQYVENPIGFEVYGYIDKMLDHYNDKEMDYILSNQDSLMRMFGV